MARDGKKVVVIGSGPGGSSVAALLQSRGWSVTLLDRNDFYGGKCWSFTRDGYVVDSGVHMFSMGASGQFGDVNRMVRGDLEWMTANPSEHLLVAGKYRLNLYQSLFDPRAVLTNLRTNALIARDLAAEKAKRGGLSKELDREVYRAAKKNSLLETLRAVARIATLNPSYLAELDEITLQEFLHRITDETIPLQGLSALSTLFTVIPYSELSAGEFMWCFANTFRKRTLGVPRGGSREIPGAFLRAFQRDGGELRLGCEVTRIVVRDGKVRGVETTAGEEIEADVVISNAGIKRTLEMAGEESFPADYVSYVKGLKYSHAYITTKYGLDRRVVDIPAPGFFSIPAVDPDHMFDYVEEGTVPDDIFLFTPFPSEWDPYAAPPGKQLIICGVVAPIEVNEENVAHCERLLDRGEERLLSIFPQIADHIEWKMRTHIAHTAAITGKPTGECIGLSQRVGQTGVHKPRPWTPVKDLWLVGTDAGARGIGTEQAAGSALYVANLLA
ncbi:MAG: NAD(P)/FAD-dependent oxidoreductase [Actinomycetota bacterium]|nr:NAD(P)/FAD-dependent oxidoreductase [Actinomycetota bacterium]MDD5667114.1 NAD(P)/FAD-dependent oxidoreductase [Actinomycetota bacterium]